MNLKRRLFRALAVDESRLLRLLTAAVAEQGLAARVAELERIIPDISDQYNTAASRLTSPYLLAKVRALHAFQVDLTLSALQELAPAPAPLLLADVGDSSGNHLRYVQALRPNLQAVSINLDAQAVAKISAKGMRAIRARAEDLAAHDLRPDAVLSFEMLEHLFDPTAFLRPLAEAGTCRCAVLTVPYREHSRVALEFTTRPAPPQPLAAEDVHVFELSPADWKKIFRVAGWQVHSERIFWQYPRRTPLRRLWRGVLATADYEGFYGIVLRPDSTYARGYRDWSGAGSGLR